MTYVFTNSDNSVHFGNFDLELFVSRTRRILRLVPKKVLIVSSTQNATTSINIGNQLQLPKVTSKTV